MSIVVQLTFANKKHIISAKGVGSVELSNCFPVWNKLSPFEQTLLTQHSVKRKVKASTILHNGEAECDGLYIVLSGQLRVFSVSDEGREITLFRLFEMDNCLFSASCMMSGLQFSVSIEAQKDSEIIIVAPDAYKKLMEESATVANYTNNLLASRMTEIMWLMEQIMWKSFDKRLAAFLLEESLLEESDCLKITHEKIAANLGTAREVVTRMLKYFQTENAVELSRGTVKITDRDVLTRLSQ